ncbi:MAG: T9SS type A sorting domain-containing protein [Candidatus Zhuqueibacterota bacterium]
MDRYTIVIKCVMWLLGWFVIFPMSSRSAQSQSLTLAWSPNPNRYISYYAIYRTTSDTLKFKRVATVNHPDTLYIDTDLSWGEHYYYAATAVDLLGNESGFSNIIDTTLCQIFGSLTSFQPDDFALFQNYPNPFNGSTLIFYYLPGSARVKITLYNVSGSQIRVLANATLQAGLHSALWDGVTADGRRAATGIYLYRIDADDFWDVKKMVLVR